MFLHTQQYVGTNISFRNTYFLRTLLLGLLSPNGNCRGICIRTYIHLSIYKINSVPTYVQRHSQPYESQNAAPPLTFFPLLKKMGAQCLIRTQVHSDRSASQIRNFKYLSTLSKNVPSSNTGKSLIPLTRLDFGLTSEKLRCYFFLKHT